MSLQLLVQCVRDADWTQLAVLPEVGRERERERGRKGGRGGRERRRESERGRERGKGVREGKRMGAYNSLSRYLQIISRSGTESQHSEHSPTTVQLSHHLATYKTECEDLKDNNTNHPRLIFQSSLVFYIHSECLPT